MRYLILFLATVISQSLTGSAYFELTESNQKIHPGKGVFYFEDKSSSLTFDDLDKAEFKSYKSNQLNFGWKSQTVWLRFNLRNKLNQDHLVLQASYALLDEVEVWCQTRDSSYHRLTGDLKPFDSREIASPYFVFNLPVKSGEDATVIMRVRSLSSMQIPLAVFAPPAYIENVQLSNFWFGIYYGFLLVMIFYNLFIYSTLKDIRYIFYSASIFFSLMFFSVFHGHAAYWLWPDATSWNQFSVHVAMGLLTCSSAVFTYSFLNLKKYAPRYRKIVVIVAVAGFVIALFSPILPIFVLTRLSTYVIMINALALTVAGFLAWKGGNKYARLFVAAWICYLLGALLLIGRNMGLLPANLVTNNFANIGSAMEVVLLSLALADKVRILRLEKEESDMTVLQMQRELNASLENKVALRTAQLQEERDKSEKLLLNILPKSIADELKESGQAKAKKHEQVSVVFTDFVNFTHICEVLSPEELVNELDQCFRLFDEISYKYGLEKIKTIGDAYLCACGVPSFREDHAIASVKAAAEMIAAIRIFNENNKSKNIPEFNIRIGIHTGPLISGVVGTRKFAYDIWGDTVNIAARMEQNSHAGKINVSQSTYEILKNEFHFEHRGKIKIKNKDEVDMYFLLE